ncbi:Hypothetical predicted protein [Cloeon dipterum]|uniref:Exonuclease domain-containing protein n=1 Tax=Cloeon dipterum TaxID=197152 RepID=A0A8S1DAI8_9INSE|nr:Hypothetical predicted protein [Cloeon dipterum]
MLPSKGKFSLYVCPHLYTSKCGRPYCQYSHAAEITSDAIPSSLQCDTFDLESLFEGRSAPSSPLPPKTTSNVVVQEDDLVPQLEALFGMEGAPDLSRYDKDSTTYQPPTYEPTPKNKLANKSTTVPRTSHASQEKTSVKIIEEYDPSPRSEPSSYIPTKKAEKRKSSSRKDVDSSKNSTSKHRERSKSSKSSSSSSSSTSKNSSDRHKKSSSHRHSKKEMERTTKEIIVLSDDDNGNDDNYSMDSPSPVEISDGETKTKKRKLDETSEANDKNAALVTEPAALDQAVIDKKKRIAHMSNSGPSVKRNAIKIRPVPLSMAQVLSNRLKMQQEKKVGTTSQGNLHEDQGTRMGCQPKGKVRVAHQPKAIDPKLIVRPKIMPCPSKIPAVRRQYVLDKLFDSYLELLNDPSEASNKASELELSILKKATTPSAYTSSFIKEQRTIVAMINGNEPASTPKNNHLYEKLTEYLLSEEQLQANGFPRPGENDEASFIDDPMRRKAKQIQPVRQNERICERCHTLYKVNEFGMPRKLDTDELCIFHPGKAFKLREFKGDLTYICCKKNASTEGCEAHIYHVSDNPHFNHKKGFVSTANISGKNRKKVYALDCEMCMTINGSELTRVTVVDDSNKIVGITKELLEAGPTKSLRHVQRDLLKLFQSDTILIGHSLHSDFRALKLIHDRVIDTSIVFPHHDSDKRLSLRKLAGMQLSRIIQENESGHDSAEDAITCMDIMRAKVGEKPIR